MADRVPLDDYLASLRHLITAALERSLVEIGAPDPLGPALHYALIAPGKRLRPCLTLAVAEEIGRAHV